MSLIPPDLVSAALLGLRYRRTSSDRQDSSIDTQEFICDEECRRLGIPIVAEFSDPDISGYMVPFAAREGGGALLRWLEEHREEAKAGRVHVFFAMQDRMGRDTADLIKTIRHLWGAGLTPHFSCEGGALPRTDDNEMLFEIKASVSQRERNQIRTRIKCQKRAARSRGEHLGGTKAPYGFDKVPTGQLRQRQGHVVAVKALVDNPEQQVWLRQMLAWEAAGWGCQRIATALTRAGCPPRDPGGLPLRWRGEVRATLGTWTARHVETILANATTKEFAARPETAAAVSALAK